MTDGNRERIGSIDGPIVRDTEQNAHHLCDLRLFGMSERRDALLDIGRGVFKKRRAVTGTGADGNPARVAKLYGGIGEFLVEYALESDLVGLHAFEIFGEESIDVKQTAGKRRISEHETVRVHVMQARTILLNKAVSHVPRTGINPQNAFDGHD